MQLETSFPDLPFMNHGDMGLKPSGTHSFAGLTPQEYPRTDLQTLRAWEFFHDIHHAIRSATASAHLSSTPFHIHAWTGLEFVANEECICGYATKMLHKPVEDMLGKLGMNGEFKLLAGGNCAIVGSLYFSWIASPGQLHLKLVICIPATSSLLVKPCWCRLNTNLVGSRSANCFW